MTVKEAVLRALIEHYPRVKNHTVQTAHPEHQLSGLTRLRGLADEGLVRYEYDPRDQAYLILTPLDQLTVLLDQLQRGSVPGAQYKIPHEDPEKRGSGGGGAVSSPRTSERRDEAETSPEKREEPGAQTGAPVIEGAAPEPAAPSQMTLNGIRKEEKIWW